MIATWMSASVFLVIIPNQRVVVADLIAGRKPDPALGAQAKQRSLHNNYLTLPVLFLMLSGHYPLAWSSRWSVAIVGLVLVAGAVVRHFFNEQHAGQGLALVDLGRGGGLPRARGLSVRRRQPGGRDRRPARGDAGRVRREGSPAVFDEAVLAIQSRCSMCHAREPAWPGIAAAPKGVRLDTAAEIARHRDGDPDPGGAHPRHAAEQPDGDDLGGAADRGGVAGAEARR